MIKTAGVIGAGGAGFPTYAKLKAEAEYILLNGAECEPLLRVDQQLMALYPLEVIRGLLIGRQITGAKRAIIGIKGKHKDVIQILERTIRENALSEEVSVGVLPDIYPAGDEQVLVYELTGRIVPETSIPITVGCVVMNVETALNVYHASMEKPVTEKYVTVAGDVPNPITVRVPVGMPLIDLLRMSGRNDFEGYRIIDGGPMMGPLRSDVDGYVTKKTKGLVVLPEDHVLIRKKGRTMQQALRLDRSACEQCSLCTDLCPRRLLGHATAPHRIVRAAAFGAAADSNVTAALTCCQCNLCEYFSCPAGISPRMANFYYMGRLRDQNIRHTPDREFTAHPMREYRLVPSKRLIARLGLSTYDKAAPLLDHTVTDVPLVGIGLHDHVGAPAVPVVSEGDRVFTGQKIAEVGEQQLGTDVHASISGIVKAIDENRIIIRRE